ncbi:MAG TPA: HlyD family efflux transporter periplasmic adaptor subunit, partial [Asanoa sp.]|nr:HlyD family efflux transporter periplasmic adaptor subunit [Asanoa sp.]
MGIGVLRGRRAMWIGGGVVVVLVVGATAAYALTSESAPTVKEAVTGRVDRGEVAVAVATTGALTPAQVRGLAFAAAGTVTAVDVRAGDQVTKGEVLARIDNADALQRVSDAQAAADSAAQGLADAERTAEDCVASAAAASRAATAKPAAKPTPKPTATPGSPRPSATATPPPTTATATTATTAATVKLVAAPGGSAAPGGCVTTGNDPILRARQQVTSADLALAGAEDALSGTTIRAPIAGKVLAVSGSVGSTVTAGGSFVTMADIAGMQIKASFAEADAGRLATGQRATVTLADRPDEEFPASVVQVDPVGTVDGSMVTFGALLAFDAVPGEVLVGQTAALKVTVASVADAVRVPSTAIRTDGSVLVRTPAGDRATPVEVGLRGDQFT